MQGAYGPDFSDKEAILLSKNIKQYITKLISLMIYVVMFRFN